MIAIKTSDFEKTRFRVLRKRVISVVLAVVLVLSMVLVAVPATFAINTGGTYFSHQETLFIDLTDVDWFADGTSVKVYTYYGDSNNSDNWNVENNKNDSDIYNAACLANALVPEHVVDGIYKFIVTGDKVGAVKVLNVNADGASVRKSSGFMLATERAGKDCIKKIGRAHV